MMDYFVRYFFILMLQCHPSLEMTFAMIKIIPYYSEECNYDDGDCPLPAEVDGFPG